VRSLERCVNVKATGHGSRHVKSEVNRCHTTPMPIVGEKSRYRSLTGFKQPKTDWRKRLGVEPTGDIVDATQRF